MRSPARAAGVEDLKGRTRYAATCCSHVDVLCKETHMNQADLMHCIAFALYSSVMTVISLPVLSCFIVY